MNDFHALFPLSLPSPHFHERHHMANIDSGASTSKRAVNQELPLVPFIDLLFCCVMFLLATVVWNSTEQIHVNRQSPGPGSVEARAQDRLFLRVQHGGFELASTAGDSSIIARVEATATEDGFDYATLAELLEHRRRLSPNETSIIVAPDDGIAFETVVATMDLAVGQGFTNMSLGDSSSL